MKKRIKQIEGTVNVGSVVQVCLRDVDRTKVDSSNITLVVVEVVKSRGGRRLQSIDLLVKRASLKICMLEAILSLLKRQHLI